MDRPTAVLQCAVSQGRVTSQGFAKAHHFPTRPPEKKEKSEWASGAPHRCPFALLLPLFNALDLADNKCSQAEVEDGDNKKGGVTDMVGQVVHQLEQDSANSDADDLGQNAHS